MAVNYFVYVLLTLSVISTFLTVEEEVREISTEEKAQLTFEKSTLYTLTESNIDKIVNSSKVSRFDDRDVMYDAKLILRNKANNTDFLESDLVINRAETYRFLNNVSFNRENIILINTDEMLYNSETKIAYNTKEFDAVYNNNTLVGTNLYFDTEKSIFKAKDTTFEVPTTN